MRGLDAAFTACDASLIEINPLAVTAAGDLLALDVKMVLDDNAQFRHADLAALRDEDEIDPAELEAQRYNLNYVHLDGNIGVMVNGAGLALATVDLLKEQRTEEQTSELQSPMRNSYAVFCLKKKKKSI